MRQHSRGRLGRIGPTEKWLIELRVHHLKKCLQLVMKKKIDDGSYQK